MELHASSTAFFQDTFVGGLFLSARVDPGRAYADAADDATPPVEGSSLLQ